MGWEEGGQHTPCCRRNARARHSNDARGPDGLDVLGHGGQAPLLEGQRRSVLADVGLFLAHFASVSSVVLVLVFLLGLARLLLLLPLDAKVVEAVKVVVVEMVVAGKLLAPAWAWPCAVSAAYLGGDAAVPWVSVRGAGEG